MRITVERHEDKSIEVGLKRSQKVRAEWIKYYEAGHRLCRVSSKIGAPRLMFLSDKPIISERVMVLKLEPATFVEVWSDIDHQIGSAWLKTNGKLYYGGKVSGWLLRDAADTPNCEFKQASSPAMKSLLLFKVP